MEMENRKIIRLETGGWEAGAFISAAKPGEVDCYGAGDMWVLIWRSVILTNPICPQVPPDALRVTQDVASWGGHHLEEAPVPLAVRQKSTNANTHNIHLQGSQNTRRHTQNELD